MIKIDTEINLHKIMRISINKTITKYYLKLKQEAQYKKERKTIKDGKMTPIFPR
jgi:hypothetical protein